MIISEEARRARQREYHRQYYRQMTPEQRKRLQAHWRARQHRLRQEPGYAEKARAAREAKSEYYQKYRQEYYRTHREELLKRAEIKRRANGMRQQPRLTEADRVERSRHSNRNYSAKFLIKNGISKSQAYYWNSKQVAKREADRQARENARFLASKDPTLIALKNERRDVIKRAKLDRVRLRRATDPEFRDRQRAISARSRSRMLNDPERLARHKAREKLRAKRQRILRLKHRELKTDEYYKLKERKRIEITRLREKAERRKLMQALAAGAAFRGADSEGH